MRFDLIAERDRFIPGWYGQNHHTPMRAEWTRPEWDWPVRLRTRLSKIARSGLIYLLARLPRRQDAATTVTSPNLNRFTEGAL